MTGRGIQKFIGRRDHRRVRPLRRRAAEVSVDLRRSRHAFPYLCPLHDAEGDYCYYLKFSDDIRSALPPG